MIGNYKIITLCGSIKFKDDFLREQKRLTLEGYIVNSAVFFDAPCEVESLTETEKQMLGDMHMRKIDLSDEIFVINRGGYIGSNTKAEIEYALKTGKKVNFMEQ